MAFSLNRLQIIGNVTRDPEVKQIPGGATVCQFGVATNFSWKDSSGARKDKAEFHNIVAWRKLGEFCGNYIKKGMKVFVEGRLQTRDWEGQDGQKRTRVEVIAENIILLDRKGTVPSSDEISETPAAMHPIAPKTPQESPAKRDEVNVIEEEVPVDDLPF